VGAIGCNFGIFGRKLEANPYLFGDFFAKRHVLLQLAVQICDALVCVAEPETNQVFWRVLFPQPRRSESPKGVSTRFRLPQSFEKWTTMAMMMVPPTAVAWRGGGGGGSGGGRGRGVGADVVVKVDVVVMLLVVVAARLTRPWDHPGCLAGILCIEHIPVTSLWRRPSESVSR
jgi:hypothetical protein